jgi:hypothetical protein
MTTLKEAAQQALDALHRHWAKDTTGLDAAHDSLRYALADQSEQALGMVQPAACISGYVQGHPVIKTVDETVLLPVGTAFYTSPPQRKPLTDDEITKLTADTWGSASIAPQSVPEFARAIERAHGIGSEE